MRIEWLKSALLDLDDAATYIAVENPVAADQFAKTMLASVEKLGDFPSLGRKGRAPNTRELIDAKWPYLIVYQVREDCIWVLGVIHTRKKPRFTW